MGAILRDAINTNGLGRFSKTLGQPGWRRSVVQTVTRLEEAEIDPQHLRDAAKDGHEERLELLAGILDSVQQARVTQNLFATAAVCEAAKSFFASGRDAPAARPRGAVLLGDRILSPCVFKLLLTWLNERPVACVALPPLASLPPAPFSLRLVATSAEVIPCAPPLAPGLAALQRSLFRTPDAPAPRDDSVLLVQTPDEVRDVSEAAREVQRAVAEGVPLDEIAITLPGNEQAEPLARSLRLAGIPARWLVGPPLAHTSPARLLLLLLEMADGQCDLHAWYELLRDPALRLRARLGASGTTGRGRWRRILARCGAVRGPSLPGALRAWLHAQDDDAAIDHAAGSALLSAVTELGTVLETLRGPGALGQHGTRWREVVRLWIRKSKESAQLDALLSSWGRSGAGPSLSLAEAIAELRDATLATTLLRGRLGDRSVLVASPMALLGGAFRRVLVTGLAHKRFPAEPSEDALLTDPLIEHLIETIDAPLLTSHHKRDQERRRFAAAVSACTERLYLSTPRFEMLEGRPILSGGLILETLGALLGRRARYGDLGAHAQRRGSRARTYPDTPEVAIGAVEHLITRAVTGDAAAILPHLATHPASRRLLQLHRSLDKEDLDAWTGLVDPEVLACPGLDGAPIPASDLVRLVSDPHTFFFKVVLGAYEPVRLPRGYDPTEPYIFRRLIIEAARAACEAKDFAEGFEDAVEDALALAIEHKPEVPEQRVDAARHQATLFLKELLSTVEPPSGRAAEGEPQKIFDELPWVLDGQHGLTDGETPFEIDKEAPAQARKWLNEKLALILHAITAGADEVGALGVDTKKYNRISIDKLKAGAHDRVEHATVLAREGLYPASRGSPFALQGEEQE
ncbi:MAG: hypothetical protein JRH20_30045 [Deltaproteobacteria bacterium]|nr:hypothetical protein [Deltaproteobacteria bacterium]